VEASVTGRPSSTTTIRGFVGANYDSRVPGIASPALSGNLLGVFFATPAAIKFEHTTSWYAGGGLTVKLGP
jgi:hypothetical protein